MQGLHVVQRPNGWAVHPENVNYDLGVYPTQQLAFQQGRIQAQIMGAELFVHDRHGKIRERNTYGVDPFPPRE